MEKGEFTIYLDYNATTPMLEEIFDEMKPFFTDYYGNPSSLHHFSSIPKNSIIKSRRNIAKLIGSAEDEIYFTSGGTESNNLAIFGYIDSLSHEKVHIITSSIEHPAVSQIMKELSTRSNINVDYLPVDVTGRISIECLKKKIRKNTRLISIIAVNNIIGTIQDLKAIGKIAERHDIIFHTDAVQAMGKIPINVKRSNIKLLSMSAHKLYGPKGVGAVFIDKTVKVKPMVLGGGQEQSLRSGTENVPGIVGFGKAAELSLKRMDDYQAQMIKLRNMFLELLKQEIDGTIHVLSDPAVTVPSTVNISIENLRGQAVVEMLNYYGIGVSTCSACSSRDNSQPICPTLDAMNLSDPVKRGAIRFSFGIPTASSDIHHAVFVLKAVVEKLRKVSG